ncbi:MxaP protein [Methylomonas sp. EFPC3]|uniref:MxaP protein n=1 Tax=Methylomonas TaxID=416 RepID=UPI00112AAB3A|nr:MULTISPECIES: MxaP protein [Methylomonas]TPQ29049.1 MxaP protein [Methylomonas koyamae]WFP50571.1 MxaP protein [Methylomonas sp. EFPC3]
MDWKRFLPALVPHAGLGHLLETYLTWSGVGIISSLIASMLDAYSDIPYAAYYTSALNDAVGFKFWILLSVIGILLFCVSVPVLYLSLRLPQLAGFSARLRRFTYTFFLVAFDEGALMIGILTANFFDTNERISLLANKSFLFSDVGFFTIVALLILDSLLWLLGEAIYSRNQRGYSGVVELLVNAPLKYALPGYLLVTGLVVQVVVTQ